VFARAAIYVVISWMAATLWLPLMIKMWWWCNACISFINHNLFHMFHTLICSRASKGLSLGELLHAFYIIIFASYRDSFYCYSHWYCTIFTYLDDLWDFLIKSLVLVFNSWKVENLIFRIFIFQGSSGTQLNRGKISCKFFIWEKTTSTISQRGRPRAQSGAHGAARYPCRTMGAYLALVRPLA
jgi:hypothetical protein